MRHYILKNEFTTDEKMMIHFAVRGMYLCNLSEMHSGQTSGAYGGFCDALERLITIKYSPEAWASLYNRYNFDCTDGDDWIEWFDNIVKEDTREIADMLSGATIQI